MNYTYEDLNSLNKDIITLADANFIYKNRGFYSSCSNGTIVKFIEEV